MIGLTAGLSEKPQKELFDATAESPEESRAMFEMAQHLASSAEA